MSLSRAWQIEMKRKAMREARKCTRCPPHACENQSASSLREARHRKTDRKIAKRRKP